MSTNYVVIIVVIKVPYDPNYANVFDGEEFVRFARYDQIEETFFVCTVFVRFMCMSAEMNNTNSAQYEAKRAADIDPCSLLA